MVVSASPGRLWEVGFRPPESLDVIMEVSEGLRQLFDLKQALQSRFANNKRATGTALRWYTHAALPWWQVKPVRAAIHGLHTGCSRLFGFQSYATCPCRSKGNPINQWRHMRVTHTIKSQKRLDYIVGFPKPRKKLPRTSFLDYYRYEIKPGSWPRTDPLSIGGFRIGLQVLWPMRRLLKPGF